MKVQVDLTLDDADADMLKRGGTVSILPTFDNVNVWIGSVRIPVVVISIWPAKTQGNAVYFNVKLRHGAEHANPV